MKIGQSLFCEHETKKLVLMHDPYSVDWKLTSKGKLVADIVDHVAKETLRAVWVFLKC